VRPGETMARTLLVAVCAVAAVLVLSMGGCEVPPVSTSPTNNAAVPVSLLFEHDGCRVYRFEDEGRDHWFVRCAGASSSTASTTENCGKHCTRVVEVPTGGGQ